MRKIFYIVVIPLLLSVSSINAYAQGGTSNKGTEFWTCYMDHINGVTGNNASSMILYITSDISTTGSVDISDGSFSQPFTVTANAVTFVTIPASAFLGSEGQFLKGIHITSAKAIAVYAHIYASSVSGATLLLPVNTMGKDYLSLNYTQRSNAANSYSAFDIIATEDTTTVSITPSAALLGGQPSGTPFTITLQKGEVYQGLSATDLTGTRIQSISTSSGTCKKIAVFSGSSKIGIGCVTTNDNNLTSDNLFQQVYPTSTWGKNYITAPLLARPYDIYRIVLSDPTTNVTLNGATPATPLINNLYYEFTSQTSNVISADKPVQVVQYTPTQGQTLNCTTDPSDIGDPEMIYLSPVEQGLDHVTLYSTGYYKILQSYINVVLPTTAISSFTLDGSPYSNFTPVTNNTAYSYARIPVTSGPQATGGGGTVTSGTHTINASAPFNAIAYGFGSTESYGYAAGTNLQDLNEYVAFEDPANTDTTLTSGCSNVAYKLQVTIPYQTTNISWNLENGNPPYVDSSPVIKSTTVKGTQTLYTYEYPNPVTYTAGSYTVVATVFDPVADVCGSYEQIEYDFNVTDPAGSNFKVAISNCLGDSTAFTDNTTVQAGNSIKTWLWDFGDAATSAKQNPNHLYASPGNYTIHLTITDNNGCTDVSAPQSVHITAKPVGSFTASTPDCAGQTVTLTNTSTTAEGTITKWLWDFGDGDTTQSQKQNPVHTYAVPGTYTVKLTVTTDAGCVSNVLSQVLTVNPTPVVNFILPDACVDDAVQFTDSSTIADNTPLTYQWDFGDTNATPANNTSTLKNPQHKYSQAGDYTVKLTVTSQNGCISSKQQVFTVNGSVPTAAFTYEDACSAQVIVFDDQSHVSFGNITKIIWYFDYDNHPEISETYTLATKPANGKYTHYYGVFNTPATKNYHVKMIVYSGESSTCMNTADYNITINANPVITLMLNNNPVTDTITLCQSDAAIQIAENKGIYTGTGVFSGTGISSTGLFNPAVSGPGTFNINYLFTTTATGCTYLTSFQVRVNPTPQVTLPSELTVLEGGELTLRPVTSISSGTITYNWTPAAGLSETDIANPVASPSENITYTLTVTSDKGCSAAAQVLVSVLKAPVVPNAFTPNNDGINDTWAIKYLDQYPDCTVEIFNRYGDRVYFSNGYPVAWDGRYKGADLPVGTYYYIINPKSGRKAISGYVAIIR